MAEAIRPADSSAFAGSEASEQGKSLRAKRVRVLALGQTFNFNDANGFVVDEPYLHVTASGSTLASFRDWDASFLMDMDEIRNYETERIIP